MTLGEKIKQYRKDLGWTQQKLAVEASLNRNSIIRYERNETMPRMPQIKRLTEALGVSMDAIFEDMAFEEITSFDSGIDYFAPQLANQMEQDGILENQDLLDKWREFGEFIQTESFKKQATIMRYVQEYRDTFKVGSLQALREFNAVTKHLIGKFAEKDGDGNAKEEE